jgi:uncharacterized protein YjbK
MRKKRSDSAHEKKSSFTLKSPQSVGVTGIENSEDLKIKVVKNIFLTRHEKYKINSDRKIIRKFFFMIPRGKFCFELDIYS